MNWAEILIGSAFSTLGVTAIAFLLKEWASTRIQESIAAEYAKASELFKQQLAWQDKRKQQAAEVAELFSIWMKHHYYPAEDVNVIRYDLQKKYWQLALWIDKPILEAVHKAFQAADNPGITHKEALIEVRKLIVGIDDTMPAAELFHFDAIK